MMASISLFRQGYGQESCPPCPISLSLSLSLFARGMRCQLSRQSLCLSLALSFLVPGSDLQALRLGQRRSSSCVEQSARTGPKSSWSERTSLACVGSSRLGSETSRPSASDPCYPMLSLLILLGAPATDLAACFRSMQLLERTDWLDSVCAGKPSSLLFLVLWCLFGEGADPFHQEQAQPSQIGQQTAPDSTANMV